MNYNSIAAMTEAGQILYIICNENNTPRGSHFIWNIIPAWVFFPVKKINKSQFLKRMICSWGCMYRPLEKARKRRNCLMWFDCAEPRQPQSVVTSHGPIKVEGFIVAVSVGLPSQAQYRESWLVLCLLCEALSRAPYQ